MSKKNSDFLSRLSPGERVSLQKICASNGCLEPIPGRHAEKLMILGFAELNWGALWPTSFARNTLAHTGH